MASETDEQRGRPCRRWRYSLRMALGVTALILIVVSHVKTSLDLRSARHTIAIQTRELARLRDELGVFEISDPSKPHVLAVRTLEPKAYRFRVYLPPRRQNYEVCVAVESIPATGVPGYMYEFQQLHGLSNDVVVPKIGGTFSVDVYLRNDEKGQLRLYVRHPQGTLQPALETDHLLAKLPGQPQVQRIEPSDNPPQLRVLEPHEPVVLIRWLACPQKDVSPDGSWPEGSHDGVMVWIR